MNEEAPTNSAGSGAIDGIGVGDKGEPGISMRAWKKYKRMNKEKSSRKLLGFTSFNEALIKEDPDPELYRAGYKHSRIQKMNTAPGGKNDAVETYKKDNKIILKVITDYGKSYHVKGKPFKSAKDAINHAEIS